MQKRNFQTVISSFHSSLLCCDPVAVTFLLAVLGALLSPSKGVARSADITKRVATIFCPDGPASMCHGSNLNDPVGRSVGAAGKKRFNNSQLSQSL